VPTSERPECLGWHEPDPVCDGDVNEPACEYKDRCLAVCSLVGGKARRTPELISAVAAEHSDADLDEWLKDREEELAALPLPKTPPIARRARSVEDFELAADEPEASLRLPTAPATVTRSAAPIPGFGTPILKRRPEHDVHPRPTPRYDHVLPIVDAIVERFARELGRAVKPENDPDMLVGDLFVRYTPGMGGRLMGLYEATARKTIRHRIITRFVLLIREPRLNLKTNCGDLIIAIGHQPPSAVVCRLWRDTKDSVTLVGVDAHTARESAQWLARLYHAGLIEGRV